jgi:hypothetical protein
MKIRRRDINLILRKMCKNGAYKVEQHKATVRQAICLSLLSCLALTSFLKMEAIYFTETSIDFKGLHDFLPQKF